MKLFDKLDLRTKILLVLIAVIAPIFGGVVYLRNEMTMPFIETEVGKTATSIAERLATNLQNDLGNLHDPAKMKERINEFIYHEPNIVRIDVMERGPEGPVLVATSAEPNFLRQVRMFNTIRVSKFTMRSGTPVIEAVVPVFSPGQSTEANVNVRVLLSLKLVQVLFTKIWRNAIVGSLLTIVILVGVFNFFLKKTIDNEKRLRLTEGQNLQLSKQIYQLEQQLLVNDKLVAMGHLTAALAHEIGSPLTAVSAHLQLLQKDIRRAVDRGQGSDLTAAERWVQRLDTVNTQVAKIEKIITDFLQTTSIPKPGLKLANTNELIQRTLAVVQPRLNEENIRGILDLDSQVGDVMIGPLEMEQVLLNLFNNAIDALTAKPAASIEKRILKVSTRREDKTGAKWAIINVYDNGVGICSANLEQLFKPFFTTKSSAKGSGLGLPICQQIIQKHGGSVQIESRFGAWTNAVVRFPSRGAA